MTGLGGGRSLLARFPCRSRIGNIGAAPQADGMARVVACLATSARQPDIEPIQLHCIFPSASTSTSSFTSSSTKTSQAQSRVHSNGSSASALSDTPSTSVRKEAQRAAKPVWTSRGESPCTLHHRLYQLTLSRTPPASSLQHAIAINCSTACLRRPPTPAAAPRDPVPLLRLSPSSKLSRTCPFAKGTPFTTRLYPTRIRSGTRSSR